jgi:hypothetical protein
VEDRTPLKSGMAIPDTGINKKVEPRTGYPINLRTGSEVKLFLHRWSDAFKNLSF